jgi:hypothetical protein
MSRLGEAWLRSKDAGEGYDEKPLPDLWYPEAGCVQQRVAGRIPGRFQMFANLFRHVVPAEVENVRHVLDDNREWLRVLDVFQKATIVRGARVLLECILFASGHGAQLGPADAGKGLACPAARTSNESAALVSSFSSPQAKA